MERFHTTGRTLRPERNAPSSHSSRCGTRRETDADGRASRWRCVGVTDSQSGDDTDMAAAIGADSTENSAGDTSPGPIPPTIRQEVKDRDLHRCRCCGEKGPGAGGDATLQVHHIEPDPDHCGRHDPENLITLCTGCHDWVHKRPTDQDVPVQFTAADREYLRPHDYEILQYLDDEGPAMVSDITDALVVEVTEVAVRERLWLLVGLDEMVASRDEQLLDRDAETGEWGFPNQIGHSVRGRVPGDLQLLIQRIEDEWVRQALERGCSREIVAEVLDIHVRTTYAKAYRAYACAFPLAALSSGDDAASLLDEGREADLANGEYARTGQRVGTDQHATQDGATDEPEPPQERATATDGAGAAVSAGQASGEDGQPETDTDDELPEEVATAIDQAIAALDELRD